MDNLKDPIASDLTNPAVSNPAQQLAILTAVTQAKVWTQPASYAAKGWAEEAALFALWEMMKTKPKKIYFILNSCDAVMNLSCYKLEPTQRRIVIEENAGAGEHTTALTVSNCEPVGCKLADGVRTTRMEGSHFILSVVDMAVSVHLTR